MRGNLNAVKCIKNKNIALFFSIRARLVCSVAFACSAVYSWYLMRNSALSMGRVYFVNCIVVFLLSMVAMAYMFMSYVEDDFRKTLNRRSVVLTKEGSILTYSYLAYENGVCMWVSYMLNMNVGEVKYNSLNGVLRFEGYFEKIVGNNVYLVNGTYDFLNVFGIDLLVNVVRDDSEIKFKNGVNYTIVD